MMARKVQSISGATGYRHQLDRARRFLDRVERPSGDDDLDPSNINDVDFQDMMWAFFQNCWHVKDWIKNDLLVPKATKDAAIDLAEQQSPDLKMCQQLCNGTKHLGPRPGASHDHIDTTIVPEQGRFEIDCMINDGQGNLISGKELARRYIAEWERILRSQGLATARLS
jgi:hypothetical protein